MTSFKSHITLIYKHIKSINYEYLPIIAIRKFLIKLNIYMDGIKYHIFNTLLQIFNTCIFSLNRVSNVNKMLISYKY